MRIVIDTNVAVSGLLWDGAPNQILRWVREGLIEIIACDKTLSELKRVIQYGRFESRISMLETSPAEIFAYCMNLVLYVSTPEVIPQKIIEDPFDNLFLALAVENQAHFIISGDKHILGLKAYRGIEIVTPIEGCRVIDILLDE